MMGFERWLKWLCGEGGNERQKKIKCNDLDLDF